MLLHRWEDRPLPATDLIDGLQDLEGVVVVALPHHVPHDLDLLLHQPVHAPLVHQLLDVVLPPDCHAPDPKQASDEVIWLDLAIVVRPASSFTCEVLT